MEFNLGPSISNWSQFELSWIELKVGQIEFNLSDCLELNST